MTAIRPSTSTVRPTATTNPHRTATSTAEVRKPVDQFEPAASCIIDIKGTRSGGNTTGTPVSSDGTCTAPPPPVVREA